MLGSFQHRKFAELRQALVLVGKREPSERHILALALNHFLPKLISKIKLLQFHTIHTVSGVIEGKRRSKPTFRLRLVLMLNGAMSFGRKIKL